MWGASLVVNLLVGSPQPSARQACSIHAPLLCASLGPGMYCSVLFCSVLYCSGPGTLVVNLLAGSLPGRKSACGEAPAKRTTGLFYPRSASASQTPSQPASKPAKLLVGSLPGRNSACGEALGLKWISVWNPSSNPRGLPLGFHKEIYAGPPWS